ncbi:Sedlin [Penicillium tannophilum]|uniref:Sedlin n=1 Tax=Penicillium frequentans TaxID=3151616 RepID=A0AAD6GLP6_9EURO|nr:Sedlin [Penicillium glabrum]KAJ5560094.1 Sedlin [Penicillium glabrum]KAJ5889735.1 Sedlin [Penicillium tannophilum]KAJ6002885.1 Sedlin [Penicillium sp. IBT 35674x]
MAGPRIACIGVIGKADNPLHIALFPPYSDAMIEFSFLLNSCLDIFEIRRKQTSIDQDLGLLHAIDERLAAYGWLTTTGVKLLIIVDLFGPEATSARLVGPAVSGLRDSDLKPAFRALQSAYIQLLQNPFYSPDDHVPTPGVTAGSASSCQSISNSKFIADVKRIGETWVPGAGV